MSYKIYIETSLILSASVWFSIGGKTLKHRGYESTCNFLQYAEMCRDQGIELFYTTNTIIKEARNKLELALENLMKETIEKQKSKKINKQKIAENVYLFLNDCFDQLDYWISLMHLEIIDQRRKDELVSIVQAEFRTLDIEFRRKNSSSWKDFNNFGLKGAVRKAAKVVRTIQRKEAIRKYKPDPGADDICILSEIWAVNQSGKGAVYLASEDGHFCAQENRDMIEKKTGIMARYAYEMLGGGLIRDIIKKKSR